MTGVWALLTKLFMPIRKIYQSSFHSMSLHMNIIMLKDKIIPNFIRNSNSFIVSLLVMKGLYFETYEATENLII